MDIQTRKDRASDVLNILLKLKGIKKTEAAEALNIKYQSLLNKFSRDSFTYAEVAEIADLCGYDIAFIDRDIQ